MMASVYRGSARCGPIEYALVWLGSVGLASRFLLAWFSAGSDDIFTWELFARVAQASGVRYLYENVPGFNHPPLMASLAHGALWLAETTGWGFPFCFKLPPLVAEIATALLLWDLCRRTVSVRHAALAFAWYGWNVDAMLVSAYHGNTDALGAFLCLLASVLVTEYHYHFAGGLALGAAVNVKLIAVLVIPALLAQPMSWRNLLRFSSGLALTAIPFVPVLMTSGGSFYRNAIAYNSFFKNWGLGFFISAGMNRWPLRRLSRLARPIFMAYGRWLIVVMVLAVSLWSRRRGRARSYDVPAMCLASFLILTPGFGVQYTIYVAPLLIAAGLAWGAAYSLLAGTFLFLVYYAFLTSSEPPFSSIIGGSFPLSSAAVGLASWTLLVAFVITRLMRWSKAPPSAQTRQ